MNKENVILKTEGLSKVYVSSKETAHTALSNIDLEINEGERIIILGPSGAGKSTLLHLLGGLDRPTDGQVFFRDKEIVCDNDKFISKIRNENFGFIFQFHHLLPEFTVLENLMMPGRFYGKYEEGVLFDRALDLLSQVDLIEHKDNFPQELSGGEQQRVAVIRALMNDPDVIFADEPTGNLDQRNRERVYEILWEKVKREKKTLVLVTHDEEAGDNDTRRVHLVDGKLAFGG
ncbi:MAG: ABC transporter ATP-binding protein [Elusimicrobiota bacterium]